MHVLLGFVIVIIEFLMVTTRGHQSFQFTLNMGNIDKQLQRITKIKVRLHTHFNNRFQSSLVVVGAIIYLFLSDFLIQ